MKPLVEKLRNGLDLNTSDISYAVTLLLSETITDTDKAELLTALHEKGESADAKSTPRQSMGRLGNYTPADSLLPRAIPRKFDNSRFPPSVRIDSG